MSGTPPTQTAQPNRRRDDQKNPQRQENQPDHGVVAGKGKSANPQPDDKHQEPEKSSFAAVAHEQKGAM
jgi:hypothetical protein